MMIVDKGIDWKDEWQTQLDGYASTSESDGPWLYRNRGSEQTTKAVNTYRAELRGFDYLTPKLRVNPSDLVQSSGGVLPDVLHFVCSPDRAKAIGDEVDGLVPSLGSGSSQQGEEGRPLLIWEPIPDSATVSYAQDWTRDFKLIIQSCLYAARQFRSMSVALPTSICLQVRFSEGAVKGTFELTLPDFPFIAC